MHLVRFDKIRKIIFEKVMLLLNSLISIDLRFDRLKYIKKIIFKQLSVLIFSDIDKTVVLKFHRSCKIE